MRINLNRYLPPGVNAYQEMKWLMIGSLASILYSFGFLIHYMESYQDLFLYNDHGVEKVLNTNAVMPDFIVVLGSSLTGFLILGLCMAVVIIYHYVYHYLGSKSIYLMKRLPSRLELHKRCFTLPLLAIAICFFTAMILLFIYYAIYIAFTPKACLTPHQWQKLWNALVGG
jgi:hypothetical protein